jgi:eukaryotic-like serine/threonine-protein kinase
VTPALANDGEAVGPYRVLQAIGAGGSARIDLARIERAYGFQRHVVIKRPLEHLRGSPEVSASLRREARIGSQLHHPNLVSILDAGVHDGYDYLVLEYVHGAPLRAVMHAETPGQVRQVPLAAALAIVSEVARGMHAAHELVNDHDAPLGLVHRDVSPGNVLLGLDGSVKLADFGIAKETRIATLSGSIRGTVTYMAPEQCQGHAFDRRADVFSLGVILYELVTGSRLFWADNDVASLHRVLSGTVPRPRKVKPQISGVLEDVILTAVAHEAANRYPTALALADAIERHAANTGEVIGARSIGSTVAHAIGARPVPWLTAAIAPDREPSLVELLAAAGPQRPGSLSFGDDGVVIVPLAEPALPAPAAPGRSRTIAVGVVVLGLFAGSAATAVLMAGPDAPPAVPAHSATSEPRATTRTAAPTPIAVPPGPTPAIAQGPDPAAPGPDPGVAPGPTPSATAGHTGNGEVPLVRKRPGPSSVPRPGRGASAAGRDSRAAVEPHPAGAGSAVAAESAAPSIPPRSNVEWSPTLLLPTDRSDAKVGP